MHLKNEDLSLPIIKSKHSLLTLLCSLLAGDAIFESDSYICTRNDAILGRSKQTFTNQRAQLFKKEPEIIISDSNAGIEVLCNAVERGSMHNLRMFSRSPHFDHC